eukprot:1144811-Pleurochrysis_carterae.AAC.2
MKRIMSTRNGWAERIVSEMSSTEGACRAGGDRALARATHPDEIALNGQEQLGWQKNLLITKFLHDYQISADVGDASGRTIKPAFQKNATEPFPPSWGMVGGKYPKGFAWTAETISGFGADAWTAD